MAREPFCAVLTPNRSLTREGYIALMAAFAGINAVAAGFFLVAGAWPVSGFMGLDVVLLWIAFRWNYRDGRWAERIEVTPEALHLERRAPSHRMERRSYLRPWVKVELEEDPKRDLVGRLFLRAHGERTEIASFLGAEERKSFAEALQSALRA